MTSICASGASNDPTPIALKEALAYGAASRVCRWRPGTRMAYCNSGPAVLAAVIEKVSGQRFENYVEENFFKPLRMDTANYFLRKGRRINGRKSMSKNWVGKRRGHNDFCAGLWLRATCQELGFKPKSLIKNIPSSSQPWKLPVKLWIRELHEKRFGRRKQTNVSQPEPAAPSVDDVGVPF